MPEMKKCKECGKLFVPKSKNSVYCDDVHYRPCPVCGKPVEAKYLSDPARCCGPECSAIRRKSNKPNKGVKVDMKYQPSYTSSESSSTSKQVDSNPLVPELNYSTDSDKLEIPFKGVKTYIGKPILNFIPGHEYELLIDRGEYTYDISASYDLTDDVSVDLLMPLASRISINQHFR